MSVLAYPPHNDDEILRCCTQKCGYILSTQDQQFFALCCIFCSERFLYFDGYIAHMQREHVKIGPNSSYENSIYGENEQIFFNESDGENRGMSNQVFGRGINGSEDFSETDANLLIPQMVMVKQELTEEETTPAQDHMNPPLNMGNQISINLKKEQNDMCSNADQTPFYGSESFNSSRNDDYSGGDYMDDDDDDLDDYDDDDNDNYDDLVEESLLQESGSCPAMHIKDRKMIQFVIDAYRKNSYLWDHRNPSFRDRKKRQQFLDYMLSEFKRRFNISLARDAITRKWDNLRTVYKRECNRMSLERTNVSTLWYFKELHFLNRLYGGNNKISEAVVKETVYRRRYSALWNDHSTGQLLSMIRNYPCFYDKSHADYRNKEKRGEALQIMANELQKIIDVSTIQISKRISQLRFDYSKQKQDRLQCEQNNKVFIPNYSYYEQMFFMDADIAPFRCEFCGAILQTSRDMETHMAMHQSPNRNGYMCPICEAVFPDVDQYQRHKQTQHPPTAANPVLPPTQPILKEPKFFCDLCTASFREKTNYDEHMRRHNDELLLPDLTEVNFNTTNMSLTNEPEITVAATVTNTDRPFICDTCGKSFPSAASLSAHARQHVGTGGSGERSYRCDFPNCGRSYVLQQSYLEHMRLHFTNDSVTCDVCGKSFKSAKNLQNHKQIHDAVKRYVCKICGSAFAQAAGLYLHKRRHTRNPDGNVDRHRSRQSY